VERRRLQQSLFITVLNSYPEVDVRGNFAGSNCPRHCLPKRGVHDRHQSNSGRPPANFQMVTRPRGNPGTEIYAVTAVGRITRGSTGPDTPCLAAPSAAEQPAECTVKKESRLVEMECILCFKTDECPTS
jgi:hypothetical protein